MKKATVLATSALCLSFAALNMAETTATESSVFHKMKAGKETFMKVCSQCHTNKYALDETYSEDDWYMTVNMMISNGAQLTDEQKLLVIDYLVTKTTFETKCSGCHDLDRALTSTKTSEEWKATVERMAEKKEGLLGEGEVEAVAAFLHLGYPEEKK